MLKNAVPLLCVLMLSVAPVAAGLGAPFAGHGLPVAHQAITEYKGPETCATCHKAAAQEVVESLHYQLQGSVLRREGWDPVDLGGMYVAYSAQAASVAGTNWLGILQPEDDSLAPQPTGCALCHVGLGKEPSRTPTDEDLSNVDCLICHSPEYERVVALDEAGNPRFVPAGGVDVVAAAQKAQRPTPEMCGRCHLYSGGGPNLAHGDYPTSGEVDVHMARGFLCVACHRTQNHQIAGGGSLMVQEYTDADVACTRCHTDKPHARRAEQVLDSHTDRVACQTCHIPLIARGADFPTLLTRDYTEPVYDEAEGLYGPAQDVRSDVMPTYLWWNNDTQASSSVTALGPLSDPGARVTPWKQMEVTVPYDVETNTPIHIDLGVYQTTGDLEPAVLVGVEASRQEISGKWRPVTEVSYLDVQHQVAPASEALWCSECHSAEGRLDFEALGYSRALVRWLTSVKFDHTGVTDCRSCHSADAPDQHFEGQCSNCHVGGVWKNVQMDHTGLTDCTGCHSDLAPRPHYPLPCSECHTPNAWSEAYYAHLGSPNCGLCHASPPNHWPLPCTECHSPTNWQASYDHTLADCSSCHIPPAGHYTGQCSSCHEPSSWQDVSVDHSGLTECSGCHTAPSGHYDGQCSSCHNTSGWTDVHFDHTGYTDCQSCHDRPADHNGDAQCSVCHNTQSWSDVNRG